MFVVKHKWEIIRFGLFLVLVGLLAYYVAGRFQAWRITRQGAVQEDVVGGPIVAGPQPSDLLAAVPEGPDFFADFRMNRDRSRAVLQETLKEVMDNENADPEARKQASQQVLAAGKIAALEDTAESLIRAKGFEDVVVSLSESTAQVVVKAKSLSQQQSMQVLDMVSRVTGRNPGTIAVVARER